MAEALAILGVVGVIYPIAQDLFRLAKNMKRAYEEVGHAKQDLYKVIKRTKSVARTYDLFKDTMTKVKKIEELAPMFKRHRKLIREVETESKRIIGRLKHITNIFRFMINVEPVSSVEKWVAQFEWFRESKKIVPCLFQDMKVLEKSMRTIGILVNTQILSRVYLRDRSHTILAPLESLKEMLRIDVRKLQQAQLVQEKLHVQHGVSPGDNLEPKSFAQEILKILEKENPRLRMDKPLHSPSTSDSRAPSSSPVSKEASLIIPPSISPPRSGGDPAFVIEPQGENISLPRPKVPRKRKTQSAPARIPPSMLPTPSFLSSVAEFKSPNQGIHEQDADQEKQGAYMQMPPFGPPKLVTRPRAGRSSSDGPNPSGDVHDQQGDGSRRHNGSSSALKIRNSSNISVYGNEGEVTPSHKTGFAGLPPGNRKGKGRSDQ
ncbi:uncharacterized protein N7482_009681 [Penicillium canariense]|uniref:Uncharacterized protein n=1 Tax=Penicillium canariense TaxID=189055 RepID=A0A9W9LG29_9EURO|nr:uncharacterized protein N7482_009681 [Penicillium canariense]KAJ5153203.1 hypothetical protein N7482_009681 [Penicillium canariense]